MSICTFSLCVLGKSAAQTVAPIHIHQHHLAKRVRLSVVRKQEATAESGA